MCGEIYPLSPDKSSVICVSISAFTINFSFHQSISNLNRYERSSKFQVLAHEEFCNFFRALSTRCLVSA